MCTTGHRCSLVALNFIAAYFTMCTTTPCGRDWFIRLLYLLNEQSERDTCVQMEIVDVNEAWTSVHMSFEARASVRMSFEAWT